MFSGVSRNCTTKAGGMWHVPGIDGDINRFQRSGSDVWYHARYQILMSIRTVLNFEVRSTPHSVLLLLLLLLLLCK